MTDKKKIGFYKAQLIKQKLINQHLEEYTHYLIGKIYKLEMEINEIKAKNIHPVTGLRYKLGWG